MIKLCITIFILLSSFALCIAADKVEAPDACDHCGMDRTKFGHSRMIVSYTDGGSAGTCSINCVVTDMAKNKAKTVKSFQVADYNTRKLTDAKTAIWVIGGSKKGVMTPVAKWAFADSKAAEAFIKQNGGSLAGFDEALNAAEKEHADRAQSRKPQEHKGHGH